MIKLTEKPRPDGLPLAPPQCKPGQSRHEAVVIARLGPAYLAWLGPSHGLRPGQAQHYLR